MHVGRDTAYILIRAILYWFNHRKKKDTEMDIFVGGEKVDTPDSTVHQGIITVKNTSRKADTERQITLGRKTTYSLMGAELHGGNGLNATLEGHIWSILLFHNFLKCWRSNFLQIST